MVKESYDDIKRGKYCCSDCQSFKCEYINNGTNPVVDFTTVKCEYEDNKRLAIDWYGVHDVYLKRPSEINKNNDCKWFLSKEHLNSNNVSIKSKNAINYRPNKNKRGDFYVKTKITW
jgi:hypothetical protein